MLYDPPEESKIWHSCSYQSHAGSQIGPQVVLVTHIVGSLVHHEAAILHPDPSVEVGVKVTDALMRKFLSS